MKQAVKIFILAFILTLLSCRKEETILTCIPSGLQRWIIAFYPFSGGALNDHTENKADLANNSSASPTSDRKGNPNSAFEFHNLPLSKEFLIKTNPVFLNGLKEFSVSLWYEPLDISRKKEAFETLISRDLGRSCPERNGQWSIALSGCRIAVFGRTNSVWDKNFSIYGCPDELNLRTNIWHHLVVTYDSKDLLMKLYRDGMLQNTTKGNDTCGSIIPAALDKGELYIGKDYTGKLDDIIFFNKALSPKEVEKLFKMEPCTDQ